MIIYDYVFLVIILIFSIAGFFFGIIKSLSKFFILLIPLFISIFGASKFNYMLITSYDFYNGTGSYVITSIILYVFMYLLAKLFFLLMETIFAYLNLSLLNRVLGLLTGFGIGFVISTTFLISVNYFFKIHTFFYTKIKGFLSFFLTI